MSPQRIQIKSLWRSDRKIIISVRSIHPFKLSSFFQFSLYLQARIEELEEELEAERNARSKVFRKLWLVYLHKWRFLGRWRDFMLQIKLDTDHFDYSR